MKTMRRCRRSFIVFALSSACCRGFFGGRNGKPGWKTGRSCDRTPHVAGQKYKVAGGFVATAAKLRYATTLRMRNMQTSLAVVVSVGLMLRLPVPVGSRKIKANRQLPSNTTFATPHGEKLGNFN